MYAYEVPLLMNLCSEVLYAHEYAPNAFVPAPQCRHTVCSAHCVRCTSAHVCCAVRVFGCVSGSKGLGFLNTYKKRGRLQRGRGAGRTRGLQTLATDGLSALSHGSISSIGSSGCLTPVLSHRSQAQTQRGAVRVCAKSLAQAHTHTER